MVTSIGKYEVESEIGHGGCGRVYRAHDPAVDRKVAIKILTSQPDPEMLVQFRTEAKTTGNLRHKNIVTVYDFGEHNGVPYLVMELLEGQNLDFTIRTRAAISLIDKLQWLQQAAEGLHYAHQMNVIHQDIKPANIMLLPSGSIKIMDFGIAHLINLANTKQMSRTSITGTPRYMAPEQITGAPADVQTDIFSFGLVCYECISGRHPFYSGEESRVIFRTASVKAESLTKLNQDCPEPLAASVNRALAFDRDVRYQSLEEMLFDFQPILLDARRNHAHALMAAVDHLQESDEPDQVRSMLRQVLEFDPSHGAARNLLEKLRADERRTALRRSSEERLLQGTARLEARDYSGAVASFEGALRSDSSCEAAHIGLAKARSLLESSRSCARLLSTSRYEAESGNVTEAFALLEQALEADPANEQALAFHRDLTISVAVQTSERLRSLEDFAGAEAVLSELRELSQDTAALKELAAVRRDRNRALEEQRRMEFEAIRASVERERNSENWTSALQLAREASQLFPEKESEIAERILEIREAQAAAKRAKVIQDSITEANNLLAASSCSQAIEALEKTLQLYPKQRTLLELKNRAVAQLLQSEIDESVRSGELAVSEARVTGNWDAALNYLSRACQVHPEVSELRRMLVTSQTGVRDHGALAEWHELESRVAELLGSTPAEAVALLVAAAACHGARPGYPALLKLARIETEFRGFLDVSRTCVAQGNWRKAGASLESAAQLSPDRPELEDLATQIATGQKLERVAAAVLAVRQAIEQHNFATARELLNRLTTLSGSEEHRAGLELELTRWEAYVQSRTCPRCGVAASPKAKFCDACGTHLSQTAAPPIMLSM